MHVLFHAIKFSKLSGLYVLEEDVSIILCTSIAGPSTLCMSRDVLIKETSNGNFKQLTETVRKKFK